MWIFLKIAERKSSAKLETTTSLGKQHSGAKLYLLRFEKGILVGVSLQESSLAVFRGSQNLVVLVLLADTVKALISSRGLIKFHAFQRRGGGFLEKGLFLIIRTKRVIISLQ